METKLIAKVNKCGHHCHNTFTFETAIHVSGYVIDEIRKSSPDRVKYVLGTVIEGTHVKRVRWDSAGKCFSPKGKELPKYDLPLEEIQSRFLSTSISSEKFGQLKSITYDRDDMDNVDRCSKAAHERLYEQINKTRK